MHGTSIWPWALGFESIGICSAEYIRFVNNHDGGGNSWFSLVIMLYHNNGFIYVCFIKRLWWVTTNDIHTYIGFQFQIWYTSTISILLQNYSIRHRYRFDFLRFQRGCGCWRMWTSGGWGEGAFGSLISLFNFIYLLCLNWLYSKNGVCQLFLNCAIAELGLNRFHCWAHSLKFKTHTKWKKNNKKSHIWNEFHSLRFAFICMQRVESASHRRSDSNFRPKS